MRADGLFVAANDTYRGRRVLALAQRVQGGNALPGGCRSQPFAQDPLRSQARAGPVAPRLQFRAVNVRQSLSSLAKQVLRFSNRQFGAHPLRRSSAVLSQEKELWLGDGMKSDGGMDGIFSD